MVSLRRLATVGASVGAVGAIAVLAAPVASADDGLIAVYRSESTCEGAGQYWGPMHQHLWGCMQLGYERYGLYDLGAY